MKKLTLGNSDLEITSIGLGAPGHVREGGSLAGNHTKTETPLLPSTNNRVLPGTDSGHGPK
jgi:hypothetical protein